MVFSHKFPSAWQDLTFEMSFKMPFDHTVGVATKVIPKAEDSLLSYIIFAVESLYCIVAIVSCQAPIKIPVGENSLNRRFPVIKEKNSLEI